MLPAARRQGRTAVHGYAAGLPLPPRACPVVAAGVARVAQVAVVVAAAVVVEVSRAVALVAAGVAGVALVAAGEVA